MTDSNATTTGRSTARKMSTTDLVKRVNELITEGKTKEEVAEATGYSVKSLSSKLSGTRSAVRKGLIASGLSEDEAKKKVKAAIMEFPRGRASGDGSGGDAAKGAAEILAGILAGEE
jgi:hypothetical protein